MADTVYVRKDAGGVVRERIASTPTDVVQLEFDGWVRKADKPAPAPAADPKPTSK